MDLFVTSLIPLWPPLLLLLAANGAPVVARLVLGQRLASPLDGGRCFIDGRPLIGPAKSWRGVIAAVVVTSLFALLLHYGWWLGALLGLLAMVGDLIASFIKRRLAIPSHGRAMGLDQLPEALLPLWLLQAPLGLDWRQVIAITLLFMLLNLLLSPLLYRLHIRRRPY